MMYCTARRTVPIEVSAESDAFCQGSCDEK